jgi:AraC family transcriptional regulator, regulatory protein of adaptative response / DNA-3-methyladenine glycosylase II
MDPTPALPDLQVCEQARLSRDPRFDGLFFTAVRSTMIYCRPVCPAPAPRPHQVTYYPSAAAAEGAGFRPCLRCRPELSPGDPGIQRGDSVLARALQLISEGALAEQPLAILASRLAVSGRHLRRLFVDRLGAPPAGVHATRRLLFAKQLLTESALPITEIALASGFGSLRRFNDSFRRSYRMAPRDLRRRPGVADASEPLTLRLAYRPPLDFAAQLDFLRARTLDGIERVDADSYWRLVGSRQRPGWLRVTHAASGHALQMQVGNVDAAGLLALVGRVRRMFDLDADPLAIATTLSKDPQLAASVRRHPGLRLPGAWDGLETAVRAVLGQQVSVAAARTLAARLLQRVGIAPDAPPQPGLDRFFPTPAEFAVADLDGLGITGNRIATLRSIAVAIADGRLDFGAAATLQAFVARWTQLPGIGPWTAHYIALRALCHPDALPAEDLVLRRIAGDGRLLSAAELRTRAEAWRPWRSYAVIHLWRAAAFPPVPLPAEALP